MYWRMVLCNFQTNRFDFLVRFASRQNERIKFGIDKQVAMLLVHQFSQ